MRLFPSRRFTGSSPKSGLYVPFSQTPAAMSFICWFKPSSVTQLASAILMAASDAVNSIGDYHSTNVETGSVLGATSVHSVGTSKTAWTTLTLNAIQADVWQLMVANFGIPSPRQLWLNDSASALSSQSTTPINFTRLSIGNIAVAGLSGLHWFAGDIALPTFRTQFTTDAERANLLSGVDPRTLPGVASAPDLATLADSFLGATWQGVSSVPELGDQIDLDNVGGSPPPPPPPPSNLAEIMMSVSAGKTISATNNSDGTVTLAIN